MRVLRYVGGERNEESRRESSERRRSVDLLSVARCPRCNGELVARVANGRPGFWCRCPVRRGLALGA